MIMAFLLHNELEIERSLRQLKYGWANNSATMALFEACKIGRADFLKLLISETSADINVKDQSDRKCIEFSMSFTLVW